ncbi:MAG: 30S ribosomal protein S17 [Candidatus Dojkabacteria bacterium]|jgi:small subunit ribosomal protein S17
MEKNNTRKSNKRIIEGVVIGNQMDKTVKVRVDRLEAHPVYKKVVKRKKVFFARTDEELNIGDKVTIRESKPLSKKIRWVVIKKD